MVEPVETATGRAPSAAGTAALLVVGALATAVLTAYALRGHESPRHLTIALGLPIVAGAALVLVLARDRLARLPMGRLLAAGVIALPALALFGTAFALPGFRELFAFRVVLAAVGVAGLLWLIFVRRRWHVEAATYVSLFGAWVCWLIVTLAWAPDPQAGLRYLVLLLSLGAVAAATASAGISRRRLKYLLIGLAIVLGLSLLIGTAEWVLRVHLPTAGAYVTHRRRPAAFFVNTNDFGTYLAFCWPFALLLPALRRRGDHPAGHRGAAGELRRTAVHGLSHQPAGGRPRDAHRRRRAARRGGRRGRLILVALAIVGLCGVGLLLLGHGGRFGSAFSVSSLASQARSGQGSGAVRLELQTAGLRAAASRLFLGVGPGNAEVVVAAQNPSFSVLNLHDWWLEVFVDGGLPALLIFVTIYLLLLGSMVRVARYAHDALLRYLGAATAIALAGFSVAIIGPSTAIKFPPMAVLFGLAVAVLIRARREALEADEGPAAASGGSPARRPDLLDFRTDADEVARSRGPARRPSSSGGDAVPAAGER